EINEELHSHEEVVDAVIYPFSYWYSNADIRVRDFPQKLPRHEIITDSVLLVETGALIAPVWNKCVRRELFADSLMFPDGLMYEDG
ncbi:glycosyltransferase family 2 protein, partial [Escherichia coli]|nr:glycosyltransferase family 2 protein [Escherichia coli]